MRLAVGCMTGTSIDALDVALVAAEGEGLAMRPGFIRGVTRPLGNLAADLRALAGQRPMSAGQIAAISHRFALLHLETIRELLMSGSGEPDTPDRSGDRSHPVGRSHPADRSHRGRGEPTPELIAIHGQTVYHAPPLSWQLLTPAPIAHALGLPVVFDLRAADLARAGEGAPITPLADWLFFRALSDATAVVNLGGFCNVTRFRAGDAAQEPAVAAAAVEGFDVCACNHLLDEVARRVLGRPFDEGGAIALSGRIHPAGLRDLSGVLAAQSGSGRSLGTGDECAAWVERVRPSAAIEDIAATACEGIAGCIAARLRGSDVVLVAGGGAKNRALVAALERLCEARVEPTDAQGLPADYREAAAMAVLGLLCKDRVPITLPRVTGVSAPAPIAGSWVMP